MIPVFLHQSLELTYIRVRVSVTVRRYQKNSLKILPSKNTLQRLKPTFTAQKAFEFGKH